MVDNRQAPSAAATLCVLVRGWVDREERVWDRSRTHGSEFPKEFKEFVQNTLGLADDDVLCPDLHMGFFSTAEPEALSGTLVREIDKAFEKKSYGKVVIIAYSSGALIARHALTVAHGVDDTGRVDDGARHAWAGDKVALRVIYLAGTLNGWEISTATPALYRFLAKPLEFAVRAICWVNTRKPPFILGLRRNEPFVVQSRLRQLALRDHFGAEGLPWEQISFLGTKDEFISPNDCVEISHVSRSIYVEVPATNHLEMLQVDRGPGGSTGKRTELIERGLTEPFAQLAKDPAFAIDEDDINDYFERLDRPRDLRAPQGGKPPNHAVIVLHGIRDNGFWTKRIAHHLKKSATRPLLRAPSPSYGFFSLEDFVRTRKRIRQTKWLLGQYADIRECYPGAQISFVGHSNGTYLAAKAMELAPAVKFANIVFGGSVVRRDYDWAARKKQGQVTGQVLNLMGSRDAVVALLPGVMEWFGLKKILDVGGAGFHGFKGRSNSGWVTNRIYRGGHKDAMGEGNWAQIADFIVTGQPPPPGTQGTRTEGEKRMGRFAPVITLALLVLAAWAVCASVVWAAGCSPVFGTLLAVFWFWFIRRVLRFF